MQKYALRNFRSDIMASGNEFISHSALCLTMINKGMQMLEIPKPTPMSIIIQYTVFL